MALGLGVLRLSSAQFWALSPRELHAASRGLYPQRTDAATRSALDALMAAFPDEHGDMQ